MSSDAKVQRGTTFETVDATLVGIVYRRVGPFPKEGGKQANVNLCRYAYDEAIPAREHKQLMICDLSIEMDMFCDPLLLSSDTSSPVVELPNAVVMPSQPLCRIRRWRWLRRSMLYVHLLLGSATSLCRCRMFVGHMRSLL